MTSSLTRPASGATRCISSWFPTRYAISGTQAKKQLPPEFPAFCPRMSSFETFWRTCSEILRIRFCSDSTSLRCTQPFIFCTSITPVEEIIVTASDLVFYFQNRPAHAKILLRLALQSPSCQAHTSSSATAFKHLHLVLVLSMCSCHSKVFLTTVRHFL